MLAEREERMKAKTDQYHRRQKPEDHFKVSQFRCCEILREATKKEAEVHVRYQYRCSS